MDARMNATLLIELLTEELPPKALARLGETFAAQLHAGLDGRALLTTRNYRWFATPRRLAVQVPGVLAEATDATVSEKIMPVAVALDAAGQPTPALRKKLEARGIPLKAVARFEKRLDGKSESFFYQATLKGAKLDEVLAGLVTDALKKLPIPKVMRWGRAENSAHQFVRPVHGLVMRHGTRLVPGEVLGLSSRHITLGHRFLSTGEIALNEADDYAETLATQGRVIAGFAERRASIARQLDAKAAELGATLNPAEDLLDEVTALVEWPVVYAAEFEREYLDVPQECLILTMQQHQKYFPLFNAAGQLTGQFLIVSNMQVADPGYIVDGNARVVRPRLADARFFFDQDRKTPLAARVEKLVQVVYHNKLGSVRQRVGRLEALAGAIAGRLGADAALAGRAARLAKADLTTDMVGEFPELQGVMGRYYALHDGEDPRLADAIRDHYRPRFAGDALPSGEIACAVALADKLDALIGFFRIGQPPTGDKDPFGLRRAALGVLRLLLETPLPLDLAELIREADALVNLTETELTLTDPTQRFKTQAASQLFDFLFERLRGLLKDAGHAQDVIEAVLAPRPARIDLVPARLAAVRTFLQQPEALALAAANKRIGNILKKTADGIPEPVAALLREDAEKALFVRVRELAPVLAAHVAAQSYAAALEALAAMRGEVDAFFDQVMVNVDDPAVRANRLGLLKALYDQLNVVADISKLGV